VRGKRDDVVDLHADADALAERVIVVRRHERQQAAAAVEAQRVENLRAAKRLVQPRMRAPGSRRRG
jgi:hypothetical protein